MSDTLERIEGRLIDTTKLEIHEHYVDYGEGDRVESFYRADDITDAPAQGFYKADEVEALLENCVGKWRSQNGAREGVTFRVAMKNIEALLDSLRGAK